MGSREEKSTDAVLYSVSGSGTELPDDDSGPNSLCSDRNKLYHEWCYLLWSTECCAMSRRSYGLSKDRCIGKI